MTHMRSLSSVYIGNLNVKNTVKSKNAMLGGVGSSSKMVSTT